MKHQICTTNKPNENIGVSAHQSRMGSLVTLNQNQYLWEAAISLLVFCKVLDALCLQCAVYEDIRLCLGKTLDHKSCEPHAADIIAAKVVGVWSKCTVGAVWVDIGQLPLIT